MRPIKQDPGSTPTEIATILVPNCPVVITSINGYQYFTANKQVHNSEFTSFGILLYTTLFRVLQDRQCKSEALL
jgi:hypothetical protein